MMLPETGAEPHLKPHLKPHLPENGSFVGAPPHVGENGPGVALEQEIGDLLWAQQHQPAPQPQSTPEETERQAMLSRVFISGNANDYKLLAQLRANPNYFQKARKLEVLREKFKRDLLKTDPDSIQPALDAQLFSLLLSNVSNLHMRYLNTFADAAYNYQNETGPLSETAVENIFYSEYRETMLKEAAKLQPFAEAMQTANGKLQEILRLFLPFDTSGVVEQFLL